MLCQEWRGTGKNPGSYILQGQKKICILPLQANEFLQNLRETRELTVPRLNLQMRTQSSNPLDCRPVSHHPPTPPPPPQGAIFCKDKKKNCILQLQGNEFFQQPKGSSGADCALVEPPDENSAQLSPGLQACEPPLPNPRSRAEELAKLCLAS